MTCAETRRQLPAPEAAAVALVAAHLEECGPCRAESDALKEVDRRLQRLGQQRLESCEQAGAQLDRQIQERLGLLQPPAPPLSRALWWGAALAILLLSALAVILRHRLIH